MVDRYPHSGEITCLHPHHHEDG